MVHEPLEDRVVNTRRQLRDRQDSVASDDGDDVVADLGRESSQ